YPMGTGNMLEVVHFGLHVCQMMGYDDINESLKFISKNSAKTLNIEEEYGIEIGKPGNLILLNADSGYDAVRRRAEVLYSIRKGKVISKTIPSKTIISVRDEKIVTFKR
ncbi:MAG: amidohydrolase family protein, partial [Clostridium sp.]